MSLINEALKKAQRQRTDEHASAAALLPGNTGSAPVRGRQPRSANATLLLASSAIVLVVVSVVITVFLVNRPSKPAPADPTLAASGAAEPANEPPLVVVPVIKPSGPVTPPAAAEPMPAVPVPEPAAPTIAPEKPPVAQAAPAPPDPRVYAWVDAIRVTGIRSSGNDSRVLMNDRVFRVNDIVDRTLGVRLIKVNADSLTFSDANGATYVKYF